MLFFPDNLPFTNWGKLSLFLLILFIFVSFFNTFFSLSCAVNLLASVRNYFQTFAAILYYKSIGE